MVVDGGATVSYDLVSLSGLLRVCEVELVLLGAKRSRAVVHSSVNEGVLFCTVATTFACRGRFSLPIEWCVLGYLRNTDEAASWCHGAPLASGCLLTLTPGRISEFVLSAGSEVTLGVVPHERLRRKFRELRFGGFGLPEPPAHLLLPRGDPLHCYYDRLSLHVGDARAGLAGLAPDEWLERHLRGAINADRSTLPVSGRGRHAHYVILRRAEDFMRANLRHNIYMNQICSAAGVSERALRYAFDDLLGLSPNRYLSMLRLCAARRGLLSDSTGHRSVKAIALSCGLWDLSRFAENYRRVFGELPRDTLMRRLSCPGIG